VQRIHRYRSRFIAIDLYLPAKKLKVINIYGYQKEDYDSKGASFCKYVMDHIKQADKEGFKIIIMGDFNADPSVYMNLLSQGRKPPKHFALVAFLINNNYIDQFPLDDSSKEYIGVFFLVKICGVLQGPFSAWIFDPAAVLRRKIFMISAQIFQILKFLRRFYKKKSAKYFK